MSLTVDDPQAFVDDPHSEAAVEAGIAEVANVEVSAVDATLKVGGRRLAASERGLQVAVDVAAIIEVEDAAAAATFVTQVEAIGMTYAISTAFVNAGIDTTVLVSGINATAATVAAGSTTSTTTTTATTVTYVTYRTRAWDSSTTDMITTTARGNSSSDVRPSRHWLADGCSHRGGGVNTTRYGVARFEGDSASAGEAVCCALDGSSATRRGDGDECISGEDDDVMMTYPQAVSECAALGMRLCESEAGLDMSCGGGCGHDAALSWIARSEADETTAESPFAGSDDEWDFARATHLRATTSAFACLAAALGTAAFV